MKSPPTIYWAAVAVVLITGSIVMHGAWTTLGGVLLLGLLMFVLRRSVVRDTVSRARTFSGGVEQFAAYMIVALPYIVHASASSHDLYAEDLAIVHALAGEDPTPGRLLWTACVLAARARGQMASRARSAVPDGETRRASTTIHVNAGALVLADKPGEIVTAVRPDGGADFILTPFTSPRGEGQVYVQAKRQPDGTVSFTPRMSPGVEPPEE